MRQKGSLLLVGGLISCFLFLTACGSKGDPERGREIFETGGGVIKELCTDCHTLDGSLLEFDSSGPSLQGISERAGSRISGLNAEEYLRESIMDPGAYVVDGFKNGMSGGYRFLLGEEDLDDLVAFLLTQ